MNLIVTIATGTRKYGDLALNLALSIKANDDEQQICLVHTASAIDGIEPLIEDYFNYTIQVTDEENPVQQAFTLKTKLYDLLTEAKISFEAAIFMDADSIILPGKKPAEWFAELKGHGFTCYCNDIYDFETQKRNRVDYTFWCDPEKVNDFYVGHPFKKMPQVNTSFIYWEECREAMEMFECANWVMTCFITEEIKHEYIKYKNSIPDELCFNIAGARLSIYPHQIPYRPLFMQCFNHNTTLEYILHQYRAIGFAGDGATPIYLVNYYNEVARYYRELYGILSDYRFIDRHNLPLQIKMMEVQPVAKRTLYRRGDVKNSDGGIFNPSGLTTSEKVDLTIFRVEQNHSPLHGYMNESAMPFLKIGCGTIYEEKYLTPKGFPEKSRLEDFRLFGYKNFVYCSHTLIERNLKMGMSAKIVISELTDKYLKFSKNVELPTKVRDIEKNWLFFFDKEEMYCVYSLEPYRLFKLRDEEWQSVSVQQPPFKWQHKGFICNSTHPILVNDFYLVLFHTKENGVYFHSAVLLDAETKEIVHIGKRCIPIMTCNEGMVPGLNYVSGAQYMADKNIIRLFIGEGDSHSMYNDFVASDLINEIMFGE